MSYPPGTHIDLSHLNKKMAVAKSEKKAGQRLYDVGTQFVFRLTPAGFQMAIKIPVAFG